MKFPFRNTVNRIFPRVDDSPSPANHTKPTERQHCQDSPPETADEVSGRELSPFDIEAVRQYQRRARRLVSSEHDAEDVVQTSYLRLLEAKAAGKAPDFEDPKNRMLFLNRIVFNEAITLIRKTKRKAHAVSLPEWYDCVDDGDRPDEALIHKERLERMQRGLATLTLHQVQLLKQRHLEELTQAQLEKCHNVTRKTIYNRLQSIYGTLRRIIDGTSQEIS